MLSIKYELKYAHPSKYSETVLTYGRKGEYVSLSQQYDTPEKAHQALVTFLTEVDYFDEELTLVVTVYKY
jgi:hypothetical protein